MGTQEKIEQFFSQYKSFAIKPKETFLHAGDQPQGVYFMKSGHVRQYDISGRTGTELTLHIFNPGSFFPLTWAIDNIPNRYFYQAVDRVEVYQAPLPDVKLFLQNNPEILLYLVQHLLYGLDGVILRLQNQVFGDAYTRTIAELLYLGRHFGHRENGQVIIDEYFTHQNIADLIGSVRETVSVALEKLIAKQLIHYNDRTIIINDRDQLEAELHKLL